MQLTETKSSAGLKPKRWLPRPVKWGLLIFFFGGAAFIVFIVGLTQHELSKMPAELPDYREELAAVLAPATDFDANLPRPTSTTLVADAATPKYSPIIPETDGMTQEVRTMRKAINLQFDHYRDMIAAYELDKKSLPPDTLIKRFGEMDIVYYEIAQEFEKLHIMMGTKPEQKTEFTREFSRRHKGLVKWRRRAVAEIMAVGGDPTRAAEQAHWNHIMDWSDWVAEQIRTDPQFVWPPNEHSVEMIEDYKGRMLSKDWQTELYYLRQSGPSGYWRLAVRTFEHKTDEMLFSIDILPTEPQHYEPWFGE